MCCKHCIHPYDEPDFYSPALVEILQPDPLSPVASNSPVWLNSTVDNVSFGRIAVVAQETVVDFAGINVLLH